MNEIDEYIKMANIDLNKRCDYEMFKIPHTMQQLKQTANRLMCEKLKLKLYYNQHIHPD